MTTNKDKSLSEVHGSVNTDLKKGVWRKLFAFLGPAYLVSVGYMDPGNWATDIAGGSQYGHKLIWVLLMSNLMALLLQSLSARLGLVAGRDLAQASRDSYPPFVNFCLYLLAEVAIAACDLAEVLGMAIGLQLLFDIPILAGVCISVLDTFLLLFLINFGIRKIEAFILSLVAIIGLSFFAEMLFAKPDLKEVANGFIPYLPDSNALYIAIGIIGATVMPHNLYLHSSLVQTRAFSRNSASIKQAIKFNIVDSTIALNMAFLVNAAILILAASAFYRNGLFGVSEIQDAHKFLEPMLGTRWAPILFAVALIAAGQSSTITGTLAGQIIMEGYLNLRIQPWMRRLITRLIAIVPAFIVIFINGESETGKLLVLSQVILSLQLGFAIIPLIHFVSDKNRMGTFAIGTLTKMAAWLCVIVIVGLNINLVIQSIIEWMTTSSNPGVIGFTIIPISIFACGLLFYITFKPFLTTIRFSSYKPHSASHSLKLEPGKSYSSIAIAVDFSDMDSKTISHALLQGGTQARYLLIHIVETPGAIIHGKNTRDYESLADRKGLDEYAAQLSALNYKVEVTLGYGNPKKVIPEIVNESKTELLVMGAHGHRGLKDLFLGTTVDAVRHGIKIPLLVARA